MAAALLVRVAVAVAMMPLTPQAIDLRSYFIQLEEVFAPVAEVAPETLDLVQETGDLFAQLRPAAVVMRTVMVMVMPATVVMSATMVMPVIAMIAIVMFVPTRPDLVQRTSQASDFTPYLTA